MTQECHSLGHSIFYQLVVKETHSVLEIGTQNFILGNENCLQDPALLNEQYTLLKWAGWHSHYSDWLWDGRSRDRIPVGVRFSAPVQTDSGAHPASCTMSTWFFPGVKSSGGVILTPHPLLEPWS